MEDHREKGTFSMKENKNLAEKLLNALFKSWSLESSSKWSEDTPAKGQCGVTALVVNDIFGGEILKTKLADGWFFYNRINGESLQNHNLMDLLNIRISLQIEEKPTQIPTLHNIGTLKIVYNNILMIN
jgi:hypothetical protein